ILDICDDGIVDVVVRIENGRIFLFKTDDFWEIDSEMITIKSNPMKIKKYWKNLPSELDIAFTVTGEHLRWANMTGRTIFVKDDKWLQFHNEKYERQGNVSIWQYLKVGKNRWGPVITQLNESVVYLSVNPNQPWNDFQPPYYFAFIFDDPYRPYHTEVNLFKSEMDFDPLSIRYLFPLSERKFLLFFDDDYTGYFCVLETIYSQVNSFRLRSTRLTDQRH
ncbi:Matrix metalloproteinase-14-like protein, partial [Dinothrombium tinctorium]